MYYTAGEGQDLSPLHSGAGSAATAEPGEWLPEDHLAFFVSELSDQFDPSAIAGIAESGSSHSARSARGSVIRR